MPNFTLRLQAGLLFVLLFGCAAPPAWVDGGETTDGGSPIDGGSALTFHRDVLPVLQARCQSCHRPGEVAPFPLTTFAEAVAWAPSLVSAVESKRMPPWPPSDACEPIRDAPRLSDEERSVFRRWLEAGLPEGNLADAKAPPDGGPGLSRVDLELTLPLPYTPHTHHAQKDDYRCFVLETGLSADQFIVGLEVVPGAKTMVHHALAFSLPKSEAQALDAKEAGPGYTCFGGPGNNSFEMLGGWAPGMPPMRVPEGTGLRLKSQNAIVLQLHYNLSNGIAADQTSLKLEWATSSVKPAFFFSLVNDQFQIPPRTTGHQDTLQLVNPFKSTAWGVLPHMHTLGTRIRVLRNDACVIDIPQWQFEWQLNYFFEKPIALTAGDRISLECTWNNPTDQTVTWGEGTADEMCIAFFYLTGS
jgi:hypothetical protein